MDHLLPLSSRNAVQFPFLIKLIKMMLITATSRTKSLMHRRSSPCCLCAPLTPAQCFITSNLLTAKMHLELAPWINLFMVFLSSLLNSSNNLLLNIKIKTFSQLHFSPEKGDYQAPYCSHSHPICDGLKKMYIEFHSPPPTLPESFYGNLSLLSTGSCVMKHFLSSTEWSLSRVTGPLFTVFVASVDGLMNLLMFFHG